jgi:DNA modification methylase
VSVLVNDPDFTLYVGDVTDTLRGLPDESVHCVVTSPPYWGLRDYGTGSWAGGDPDCDHVKKEPRPGMTDGPAPGYREEFRTGAGSRDLAASYYGNTCGKCGATRTDQQLGLEATPDLFVARMVDVFREIRRVLRADGTCWVNLGDSYAQTFHEREGRDTEQQRERFSSDEERRKRGDDRNPYARGIGRRDRTRGIPTGLKPKDLVGIPWRVAFALQADGWYLRSDIIWSKPNPMPESVTDRPTKAHEYVFLLTRSPRYFFDADAVREAASLNTHGGGVSHVYERDGTTGLRAHSGLLAAANRAHSGRNIRSVWEIATQPYPEAHFATFPEALPERCIKAGTSERGCCPECGAPWEREVEKTAVPHWKGGNKGRGVGDANGMTDMSHMGRFNWSTTTLGWRPGCGCDIASPAEDMERARKYEPVPCTVLDPFMGSGTTALVARRLGRRSIGIELNPDYAALCARRLQQLSLFAGDVS